MARWSVHGGGVARSQLTIKTITVIISVAAAPSQHRYLGCNHVMPVTKTCDARVDSQMSELRPTLFWLYWEGLWYCD